MVSLDKAVIARLKKGERNFEILVDCEKALDLKHGKQMNMTDILAVSEIYKDARKGELAAGLKDAFGTEEADEIAKQIIQHGEVQITAEYRRKLLEEKKNRIIQKIVRNAVDARTNLPIPEQRVRLAFEQAKTHIEVSKSDDQEFEEVVKQLRFILPIKFENKVFRVLIPQEYAMRIFGSIKKAAKVKKEEWLNNGSLQMLFEMPAGEVSEFYDKVNKLTHGNAIITEVKE